MYILVRFEKVWEWEWPELCSDPKKMTLHRKGKKKKREAKLILGKICILPEIDWNGWTPQNWPKFYSRWNRWYYRSGLYTGAQNSGWNGMKSITLFFKTMYAVLWLTIVQHFKTVAEWKMFLWLTLTLRIRLVHWMWITTGMVIFITRNKMCCNGITKLIH